MNRTLIFSWIRRLFAPTLVSVLGLTLLVSPDSASAMVGKITGWALLLAGVVSGLEAFADRNVKTRKVVCAIAFLALGGWLLSDPLALAAMAGRLVGIALAIRGFSDLAEANQMGTSRGLAIVTAVAGIMLVLLPMTTSRLVLRLVGAVALSMGIMMVISRVKQQKRLNGGEDPNIIDAL